MRKRPKQPKWIKAFKRKIRTTSYANDYAYKRFAEVLGISVEELELDFPRIEKRKANETKQHTA